MEGKGWRSRFLFFYENDNLFPWDERERTTAEDHSNVLLTMSLCLGDGEALSCVMLNKILFLPNSLGGAKISLGPKWHCLRFIQRGPSPLSCMESHPAVNYHLNRRSHVLERATPVLAFFHRDMYWGSYKVLTFLCEAVQLGCSSPRNKKKITFWQVYSLKEEKKIKLGGSPARVWF